MRKNKFLILTLAAVLTGSVVSFTSCVDDVESPSVSNIRNSKAELMKAEAALATAQAEVARTLATAEAALMTAQAEKARAEAKVAEAQAAYQNAQTEALKAAAAVELEKAKNDLRQAQALADVIIEKAKSDLELAKLQAQIDLQAMQNQLDKLKIEDPVLQEAVTKYQAFIAKVNSLTVAVAELKLDLARTEALKANSIAEEEEFVAYAIKQFNSVIANNNKNIAENEIMIANWNTLLASGTPNAVEEIAKLQVQIDAIRFGEYTAAERAVVAADRDAAAAHKAMREAEDVVRDFRKTALKSYDYISPRIGFNDFPHYNWGLTAAIYYTVNELTVMLNTAKNNFANSTLAADLDEAEEKYAEAEENLVALHTAWLAAQVEVAAAQEVEKAAQEAAQEANTAVAEAQALLDAAVTDAEIAAAQAELIRAQAAKLIADEAWTTAVINRIEAVEARNEAQTAYNDAKFIVDTYPLYIAYLRMQIADAMENIADIEAALALYNNDSATPSKLEAAYVAAVAAWVTAEEAYQAAWEVLSDLDVQIAGLRRMQDDIRWFVYEVGGGITFVNTQWIEARILGLEDDIADWQAYNAQINRDIDKVKEDGVKAIAMIDVRIDKLKADIAAKEVELAAAQVQAAAAKAVMDARMK